MSAKIAISLRLDPSVVDALDETVRTSRRAGRAPSRAGLITSIIEAAVKPGSKIEGREP
jgi:hypothetical protein